MPLLKVRVSATINIQITCLRYIIYFLLVFRCSCLLIHFDGLIHQSLNGFVYFPQTAGPRWISRRTRAHLLLNKRGDALGNSGCASPGDLFPRILLIETKTVTERDWVNALFQPYTHA